MYEVCSYETNRHLAFRDYLKIYP
ncbi:hypothetical protein [Heyndrickxia vini]|uniref:Uncharacterized protein n=1 Tax=Heyndrickxia vini TaxID=1476025 RepID=A0ABX7E866_9BACI|nr:hypothetical protein [Heyndrickxia vini]QQZ11565.1 hypothetical protein I5776_15525 [Heyndrickxia vini]